MLTAVSSATGATTGSNARKQVVAYSSNAGAVMYTVPAGRTFTGIATSSYTNGNTYLTINNVRFAMDFLNNSGGVGACPVIPLTLIAGTVVKYGGGGGVSLIGVEE